MLDSIARQAKYVIDFTATGKVFMIVRRTGMRDVCSGAHDTLREAIDYVAKKLP